MVKSNGEHTLRARAPVQQDRRNQGAFTHRNRGQDPPKRILANGGKFALLQVGDVDPFEMQTAAIIGDPRPPAPLVLEKAERKRIMSRGESRQRPMQGIDIQPLRRAQVQHLHEQVGIGRRPGEESGLARRQRHHRAGHRRISTVFVPGGRGRAVAVGLDQVRQGGQRRCRCRPIHGQCHAKVTFDQHQEFHLFQGIEADPVDGRVGTKEGFRLGRQLRQTPDQIVDQGGHPFDTVGVRHAPDLGGTCATGPLQRAGKSRQGFPGAVDVGLAAGPPTYLAAGRARQGPRRQQHDIRGRQSHLVGEAALHGGEHPGPIRVAAMVAADFNGDDKGLPIAGFDGKCRGRRRRKRRMALGQGVLDIAGGDVPTPDDDQVLQAPGDVKSALPDKAQVARRQRFPPARCRIAPVATHDRRPRQANLTLSPMGQRLPAVRIGNVERQALTRCSAGHQGAGRSAINAGCGHGQTTGGGLGIEMRDDRADRAGRRSRRHQRRFGQAVARIERSLVESERRKSLREAVDGRGAHRLGPAEGQTPARQVERGAFRVAQRIGAKIIGEIGAAADIGAVAVDGLKPGDRPGDEGFRIHENDAIAAPQGLDDAADQPHVVIGWQPVDDDAVRRQLEPRLDGREVGGKIRVVDHHAFRRRR